MRMAAQYELLKELLNSGTTLNFEQEFFFKFYQAFILKDRWTQYIKGVSTTLLVTAIALALGIVLGSVVALVRVAHDQQRPGHKNPVLGFFNIICEIYTTIIRGTPMMVQLLIMSMVIFANSRNFTMVGALALGINSGAYVSEIIRGGLMAVDPGQMEAGRSLGLNYMTTMVVIIIPQAIRAVLPALGNEFIVLLKDTSLITVIGGKELLYAAPDHIAAVNINIDALQHVQSGGGQLCARLLFAAVGFCQAADFQNLIGHFEQASSQTLPADG